MMGQGARRGLAQNRKTAFCLQAYSGVEVEPVPAAQGLPVVLAQGGNDEAP